MNNKFFTSPSRFYLITCAAILLFFTLPIFAQEVKSKQAKKPNNIAGPRFISVEENNAEAARLQAQLQRKNQPQTKQGTKQNPPVKKLNKFDMATAHQTWSDWYKAKDHGMRLSEPTLTVNNADEKEFNRMTRIWLQAQVDAYRDIQLQRKKATLFITGSPPDLEKRAYQTWLEWFQARQQGQKPLTPALDVHGVDEKEFNRIVGIWQQAQAQAHTALVEETVYQIWLEWFQAQQQGKQLPMPAFTIPDTFDAEEANRLRTIWPKAILRAQLEVKRQTENASKSIGQTVGQTQAQQVKQQSVQAGHPTISQTATQPNIQAPLSNNNASPTTIANANPRPSNQTQTIAGVIAKTTNPIQPNRYDSVTANNNRILAEIDADIANAKAAAANHQIQPKTSGNGPTNINPANATGLQVVKRYAYGNGPGPISQQQLINGQWVTSYYIYDGQSNVRALTDENGNITDTYDYDAFGNLINQTGNTPNTRLYAAEEFDPDLGLYYNRSRYLNTATGRFWTQDSYEGDFFKPKSLHKYLYTENNPVNGRDPSGHQNLATVAINTGLQLGLSNFSTIRNIVVASAIVCTLNLALTASDLPAFALPPPCGFNTRKRAIYNTSSLRAGIISSTSTIVPSFNKAIAGETYIEGPYTDPSVKLTFARLRGRLDTILLTGAEEAEEYFEFDVNPFEVTNRGGFSFIYGPIYIKFRNYIRRTRRLP